MTGQRRDDRLKVVIAGAGNVGSYLAADLHKAGHEVLLIENDPAVAARGANLGVEWMVRDACEVSALDAAGLASADVVVAATGDDEDNLVISLLAKQEFAVPRVVAGSTTRRTTGFSTRPGGSTSPCRLRTCWPRSSKRRSRSVRWSGSCSSSLPGPTSSK